MAAQAAAGHPTQAIPRRFAAAVVLTLALLAASGLVAGFLWPDGEMPTLTQRIGHIDDFAASTVIPVRLPESIERGLWAVRLADGELLLLSRRSTGRGCTAVWGPDRTEAGQTGAFFDPCQAAAWTIEGELLFGSVARRDLDRFEYHVDGSGRVVVHIEELVRGAQRPSAPHGRPAS